MRSILGNDLLEKEVKKKFAGNGNGGGVGSLRPARWRQRPPRRHEGVRHQRARNHRSAVPADQQPAAGHQRHLHAAVRTSTQSPTSLHAIGAHFQTSWLMGCPFCCRIPFPGSRWRPQERTGRQFRIGDCRVDDGHAPLLRQTAP